MSPEARAEAKRQKEIKIGKKYTISITTGRDTQRPALVPATDGTNTDVFIKLHGETGQSIETKLEISKEHPLNKFESGNTDTFKIRIKDKLGPITHVKVRTDNSVHHTLKAGVPGSTNWYRWLLARVAVFDAEWNVLITAQLFSNPGRSAPPHL